MQRYFLTENIRIGATFMLPDDIAHHFMTVLRSKVGSEAEFVLADREEVVLAKVQQSDVNGTEMVVLSSSRPQVELPVETTLIIALTKGDKPELVTQKATELGVHRLIFVETAWSVVHWGSKYEKKLARLLKIAQGAAEQSHRLVVPSVQYVDNIRDLDLPADMVKLVAWEESAKNGETGQLAQSFAGLTAGQSIAFMIGPEGGLKESELDFLKTVGFKAAGLGPRILRAETAPMYVLSALSFALELNR